MAEAAIWKARVESDAASESDFLEFEAWLALPGARGAFDRIDALSADIADHREIIGRAMARADDALRAAAEESARKSESRRRFVMRSAGFGALAAAAVGGVVLPPRLGWVSYTTGKGERRSVKLADGTTIQINSASVLEAKLAGDARRVAMGEGEASFDVAHDEKRPFLIAIGERQVRVIGTEFNILNSAGRLAVTVRRGIVDVSSTRAGVFDVARLMAGDQLEFGENKIVRRANAAERAFAWQSGRLIYDGASLAELVSDLNRYYPGVIRVEGADAASLKFSGVLTLDAEERVIRTLEGFLPIEASSIDGALVLRKRDNALAP